MKKLIFPIFLIMIIFLISLASAVNETKFGYVTGTTLTTTATIGGTTGNGSFTGNVSGKYFIGNGSLLTDIYVDGNTTEQIRTAVNNSPGTYSIKVNDSDYWDDLSNTTEITGLGDSNIVSLSWIRLVSFPEHIGLNVSSTLLSINTTFTDTRYYAQALIDGMFIDVNATINTKTTLFQAGRELGNWSAERGFFYNITRVDSMFSDVNASIAQKGNSNLTLAQVSASVGNWSADQSSYVTFARSEANDAEQNLTIDGKTSLSDAGRALGNYSAERDFFYNKTETDSKFSDVNSTIAQKGSSNLTLSQVSNSVGNWTADKASYSLTAKINADNADQNNTIDSKTTLAASLIYSGLNLGNYSAERNFFYNKTQTQAYFLDINNSLITVIYNATSNHTTLGTASGGINLIQVYDSIPLNVTEVAGDMIYLVNFTNITSFNQIIVRFKSSISETHTMSVELYDYLDGDWETYGVISDVNNYSVFTYGVFDSGNHVSGGVVQLRFYSVNAAGTHVRYFDWIAISKGLATPSSIETDPYSIHSNGQVQLTNDWNAGSWGITASWFSGLWNQSINYYNITQVDALIAGIGNWTADKSSYITFARSEANDAAQNSTIDGKITEVKANAQMSDMNNTISGKGTSNLTLVQVEASIGNWTLDKGNYSLTAKINADNLDQNNTISTKGTSNLTLSQVSASVGNWTADQSSYITFARSEANDAAQNSTISDKANSNKVNADLADINDTISSENTTVWNFLDIVDLNMFNQNFCYQESSNTSNQTGIDGSCGINYNGSYAWSSWLGGEYITNTTDGDWDSFGRADDIGYMYINYSKPDGSTVFSLWQVKTNSGTYNVSIVNSCWNQEPLQLRIKSTPSLVQTNDWSCYDGSSWISLGNGGDNIYEDAMLWKFYSPLYSTTTRIIADNADQNITIATNTRKITSLGNYSNENSTIIHSDNASWVAGKIDNNTAIHSNNVTWITDNQNNASGGTSNLTLAQVSASVGNWTADKPSYATEAKSNAQMSDMNTTIAGKTTMTAVVSNVVNLVGNWTLDKSSYITFARSEANDAAQNTTIDGKTTLASSLVYAGLNLGNYSAERGFYYNQTQTNALVAGVGNWTADKSSYATEAKSNAQMSDMNATIAGKTTLSAVLSSVGNFTKENDTLVHFTNRTWITDNQNNGSFTYSSFFNQNLNTTNAVRFSDINTSRINVSRVYVGVDGTNFITIERVGAGAGKFTISIGTGSLQFSNYNGTDYSGDISFTTKNGGTSLNIKNGGFIGVNTDNPNATLHINGDLLGKNATFTDIGVRNINISGVPLSSQLSDMNTTINSKGTSNLTLAQVGASVGNWTSDQSSYITFVRSEANDAAQNTTIAGKTTLASVLASIGNWTLDKSSYITEAKANAQMSDMNSTISGKTTLDASLVYAGLNLGNYSAEKSFYFNSTRLINSLGNFTANIGGINSNLTQAWINVNNTKASSGSNASFTMINVTSGGMNVTGNVYLNATNKYISANVSCVIIQGATSRYEVC